MKISTGVIFSTPSQHPHRQGIFHRPLAGRTNLPVLREAWIVVQAGNFKAPRGRTPAAISPLGLRRAAPVGDADAFDAGDALSGGREFADVDSTAKGEIVRIEEPD